jgi:hypothetical protein
MTMGETSLTLRWKHKRTALPPLPHHLDLFELLLSTLGTESTSVRLFQLEQYPLVDK